MNRNIISFASIVAFAAMMFTGCSDGSPVDSGASDDAAYDVYTINESDLSDYSEIPTFDEVMSGTFAKPAPREFGKFIVASYVHKIRRLDLSDDQKASVKLCFADYRSCVRDASTTYHDARKSLHDGLKTELSPLRDSVLSGSLTREEARGEMEIIVQEYRDAVKPYNESYRAAVRSCRDGFESCVAGVLTAEQLEKWESGND